MMALLHTFSGFLPAAACVIGALLGSVANMLIHRLPKQMDLVFKRSFCPSCNKQLAIRSLVPILSYLIQKGKCSHCKIGIPVRYLHVELLFILFVFSYVWPESAFYLNHQFLLFSLGSVILFYTDLETFILPLPVTLSLMGLGVALSYKQLVLVSFYKPFIILIGTILVFRWACNKFYKQDCLGLGDVLLIVAICLNWGMFIGCMSLYCGIIIGGVSAALSVMMRKKSSKDVIPFGPFLIIGFYIAIFFRLPLFNYFLG